MHKVIVTVTPLTASPLSRPLYQWGSHRQTIIRWREQYPGLAEQLDQAREQARRKALAIIKQAALNGDYNAAVQFLRFSFHPDYCKPDTKVQVTATAQALVCDEPTRQRLIDLNQRLLAGSEPALPKNTEPNDTYD